MSLVPDPEPFLPLLPSTSVSGRLCGEEIEIGQSVHHGRAPSSDACNRCEYIGRFSRRLYEDWT